MVITTKRIQIPPEFYGGADLEKAKISFVHDRCFDIYSPAGDGHGGAAVRVLARRVLSLRRKEHRVVRHKPADGADAGRAEKRSARPELAAVQLFPGRRRGDIHGDLLLCAQPLLADIAAV